MVKNNQPCLFCDIVIKKITTPGIFWEDDQFMAFLAIDPNTEGFSVVIPKQHYGSDVLKMPDQILVKFVLAAKQVAQILENHFPEVGRVGLMMEGTGVDHAHIKLMPMHKTTNLKDGQWQSYSSQQEIWFDQYEGWICSAGGPMADPADLERLANQLNQSISQSHE